MIWQYIGGAAVTGLVTIIVLLLNRLFAKRDRREDGQNEIENRLSKLESSYTTLQQAVNRVMGDTCRIQMLLMLTNYPKEVNQIMKIAEHYFRVMGGDWYMTGLFNCWLEEQNVGHPEWFNPND